MLSFCIRLVLAFILKQCLNKFVLNLGLIWQSSTDEKLLSCGPKSCISVVYFVQNLQ